MKRMPTTTADDELDDSDIRELLQELDNDDDVNVSPWEAEFIENLVYDYGGLLSMKQRESALKILEKYDRI